jgi:RimJ/RimL family protein N-acetyltransferase
MKEKLLLQEEEYSICRYDYIPNEAIHFLDSIAWGNDGAVYEHKNTEKHIRLLHKPSLIAIQDKDKIQATAVFCNTPITSGSNELNCYYIRYFASSKEIRGKGVVKRFAGKVMELIREDEKKKTVFFACIEKGNRASYKAVENAGYVNIGTVKTIGFSRFFPKRSNTIERVVTKGVREEVINLLKLQYADHKLVQFNSIFLNNDYYVIRENGEIVAGCQAHRVHWVINKMNGVSGKIIMNVVPIIPLINKLFNPRKFEFLAFEGIYCKEGSENRLVELFEGILAKENLKSSMLWLGETCSLRKRIMNHCSVGLLHTFVKDSDVYIMASFHDLNEYEINDMKERPVFASAFDYI